ncbi:sugar ABC transporter permease [Brachybacterium sp. Z12]|uniref:carbohydrate ABC transporter permease n=1 Tax=Brachybacterium sp. Z12 TaxID=2759167 RepID=UPI0018621F85|nr:sugar ABC transporter permease [Brachybacterium sp. Z12]QNN82072.1 sugar ABC transporter permease [Brachybacterium sp. Z12]
MSTTAPSRTTDGDGESHPRSPIVHRRRRIDPLYYLFLFPSLTLFSLAVTLPAVLGFGYSFTNSIGFGDWEFIGLRNYIAMFRDQGVLGSYTFTLGFSLITVILVNILAFALALGLTSKIRFTTALRTIYVIPMVISGIVIAFVFQYLFANTVPGMGQAIGSDALSTSILANPDWAWLSIVIVTAWQSIPATMLIYIAGLVTIPGEVYEAGSIDGATGWQAIRHITLPLVSGFIVINTILGFKNYLNAYDIIVGLTDGGPGVATRSVAMSIFRGFEGGDYAYQMANAMVFFLISIALALLQLRITRGRTAF